MRTLSHPVTCFDDVIFRKSAGFYQGRGERCRQVWKQGFQGIIGVKFAAETCLTVRLPEENICGTVSK